MDETRQSRFLPNDFPVAIVEHTEGGRIEYANQAFEDLFFRSVANDPFRRDKSVDFPISVLRGAGASGEVTEEDRREFGRVDYFIPWDDHSLSFDKVLKLGFPRTQGLEEGTEEHRVARNATFKDERYFRFWTKERSELNAHGEKVYISAVIELTLSERQRREMREVESRFAAKLSSVLIDDRLKDQDIFELRNRPKSGGFRASGDFFLFWKIEHSTRLWFSNYRYAVIFIGDSSEKELLAAASVQQAATILVPFCKSPPNMFFDEDNPAEFLLRRLNSQFISSRIMGNDRIDGAVLVFDMASRVLHYAGGGPGGILLGDTANGGIRTLADDLEASFGPSIGADQDTKFVSGSTKALPPETVIIGITDGVRYRLERELDGDELSVKDRIEVCCERCL